MADVRLTEQLATGYPSDHACVILGTGIHDAAPIPNLSISIPLKSFNRHGLIAGSTSSGKTKTQPTAYPIEFLSLSKQPGVHLRTTASS